MAKVDLKGMTLKQMLDLQVQLEDSIKEKRVEERDEIKRAVADLVERRGFSVDELYGKPGKGKGKGSVAPKFRNPDNPSETWTGRGRKPNWLVSAMKKTGANMEKFTI